MVPIYQCATKITTPLGGNAALQDCCTFRNLDVLSLYAKLVVMFGLKLLSFIDNLGYLDNHPLTHCFGEAHLQHRIINANFPSLAS